MSLGKKGEKTAGGKHRSTSDNREEPDQRDKNPDEDRSAKQFTPRFGLKKSLTFCKKRRKIYLHYIDIFLMNSIA